MPELPEVETVREGLSKWVSGRRVAQVEVLHPRATRRHVAGPVDFAAALRGVTVTQVHRRGKYLWLALDSGDAVVGHLGMSGQMIMQPTGAADEKHLRIRFRFDDGGPELRFVIVAYVGGLAVSRGGAELPAEIAHIALDPFDASYVETTVAALLRARGRRWVSVRGRFARGRCPRRPRAVFPGSTASRRRRGRRLAQR